MFNWKLTYYKISQREKTLMLDTIICHDWMKHVRNIMYGVNKEIIHSHKLIYDNISLLTFIIVGNNKCKCNQCKQVHLSANWNMMRFSIGIACKDLCGQNNIWTFLTLWNNACFSLLYCSLFLTSHQLWKMKNVQRIGMYFVLYLTFISDFCVY